MTRPRLAYSNPAPVVGPMPTQFEAPKPTPLISSEARRKEQEGERFYPRVHLKPLELPSMYLALTAFPQRVVRRHWRTPVAVAVGAVVGLAVLGVSGHLVVSCALGAAAGWAVQVSDGWFR